MLTAFLEVKHNALYGSRDRLGGVFSCSYTLDGIELCECEGKTLFYEKMTKFSRAFMNIQTISMVKICQTEDIV